jgi:tetratricopeptide (TPR) repeat protein
MSPPNAKVAESGPAAADPARTLLERASQARGRQRAIEVQLYALDEARRDVGRERRTKLDERRAVLVAEADRALSEAIEVYARVADDPALGAEVDRAEVLFDLGRALADADRPTEAAARYEALVREAPSSPRAAQAHLALAERAFAEERLGEAVEHCDRALAGPGPVDRVEALYLKAWSLRGLGESARPGATRDAMAALEAIGREPVRSAAAARIAEAARQELLALRNREGG